MVRTCSTILRRNWRQRRWTVLLGRHLVYFLRCCLLVGGSWSVARRWWDRVSRPVDARLWLACLRCASAAAPRLQDGRGKADSGMRMGWTSRKRGRGKGRETRVTTQTRRANDFFHRWARAMVRATGRWRARAGAEVTRGVKVASDRTGGAALCSRYGRREDGGWKPAVSVLDQLSISALDIPLYPSTCASFLLLHAF